MTATNPRWTTIPARSAAGLIAVGVISGFAVVALGANTVRAAYSEDADIFGFLRQAFGGPPAAVQRYEPSAEMEPRRSWRRGNPRDQRLSRREALRQIHQRRRQANLALVRREAQQQARQQRRLAAREPKVDRLPRHRYASLPAEPQEPRMWVTPVAALPDFSGTVDARFVQEESKAYQVAMTGKDGQSGWLTGRQTMCVRLCDGYAFPVGQLGSLKDLPLHQTACNTSCPGAATALFTLRPGETDLTEARSLSGQSYGILRTALAYRQKLVPACSCHGAGQVALPRLPLNQDRTLRAGDTIAGFRSPYVLSGKQNLQLLSLRQDRSLSRTARQQVEQAYGITKDNTVRVKLTAAQAEQKEPPATNEPSPGGVRVVVPSPY